MISKRILLVILALSIIFVDIGLLTKNVNAANTSNYENTYGISYESLFESYPEYLAKANNISILIGNMEMWGRDASVEAHQHLSDAEFVHMLDKGGEGIIDMILGKTGIKETEYEDYRYKVAMSILRDYYASESEKATVSRQISSKLTAFNKYVDFRGDVGEFASKWSSNFKGCGNNEQVKEIIKTLSVDDRIANTLDSSVKIYNVVVELMILQEYQYESVNLLLDAVNAVSPNSEISIALQQIKRDMEKDPVAYMLSHFVTDVILEEVIEYVAKKMATALIGSKAVLAMSIAADVLVFIYENINPSYEEIQKVFIASALYNETSSCVNKYITKFCNNNYTAKDIERYEIVYNLRLSTLKVFMKAGLACMKKCKDEEGLTQRLKYNSAMIGTTLTYEEYIRHCSAKVKKDIDDGVINKAEDNKEESVPATAEVEAAIKWVKSCVGQSIDYDGVYGAECVDLIKAYYNYLGVSPVTGNGADYTSNVLPSGWLRIQGAKPQKGDILVYTGGYGHVAIYESYYSHYHQNYAGKQYVVQVTNIPYNHSAIQASTPYWGVIRPVFNEYTMPTSVELNKKSVTLTSEGDTATLLATVSPSSAVNKNIIWVTSDSEVATVSDNGVITAVSEGTAVISAVTEAGANIDSCNVTISIPVEKTEANVPSNPVLNADGWYYTPALPSDITTDKYVIQIQNIYEKYAISSPGSDWTNTGETKTTYVKSGDTFESAFPQIITDTLKLDGYYYYHVCGPTTGIHANFESWNEYVHYDCLYDVDSLVEHASYQDKDDSRYTYYHLKWTSGYDAYCWRDATTGTCDIKYGQHGYRSYYWYKMYIYQRYTATTTNKYQKVSSWTTTKDTSATTYKYRFKLKPVIIEVTDVSLNLKNAILQGKGSTTNLAATVSPNNATNKTIIWASDNPAVATVSNGKVTAISSGTARITATCGKYSSTCIVTVTEPLISIALNKTSLSMNVGMKETLNVSYNPVNTTDSKEITWKSSDNDIATVDNGMVTALKAGTVTITATCGKQKSSCIITVKQPLTGISISSSNVELDVNDIEKLSVIYNNPDTTDKKDVVWKSSDESIVLVVNGKLTALKAGTVTITAICGDNKSTCTVNVKQPMKGINFNKSNIVLKNGDKTTLSVLFSPVDTTDSKNIIWSSGNESVAIVNNGKITATGAGETVIIALCNGFIAECKIVVKEETTDFETPTQEITQEDVTDSENDNSTEEMGESIQQTEVSGETLDDIDSSDKTIEENLDKSENDNNDDLIKVVIGIIIGCVILMIAMGMVVIVILRKKK